VLRFSAEGADLILNEVRKIKRISDGFSRVWTSAFSFSNPALPVLCKLECPV